MFVTPFAFLVAGWVEEDVVSPLLLPPLVHVGDGEELGLVFHKEVLVENPTDVSIEPEALCGADESKRKEVFYSSSNIEANKKPGWCS